MAGNDLGPWEPLGLEEVRHLFARFPARWWITGGQALELHLGRCWRTHADTDVSVLREDSSELLHVLVEWDINVAAAGALSPWDGSTPTVDAEQNNLWCRMAKGQPWCIDVTISDGNQEFWIYRRDPTVQVRWDEAVLTNERGIPYLAPELQLLFKSNRVRRKDELDAAEVIPELSEARRLRLRSYLPGDHPWHALMDSVMRSLRTGGALARTRMVATASASLPVSAH